MRNAPTADTHPSERLPECVTRRPVPRRPLPRLAPSLKLLLGAVAAGGMASATAQDAARGAGLYLRLPEGVASCVSCHGPDPSQNRNRLLFAADRPDALLRALNTVAAMGYLRSTLSDTDVADLAAYLGRVLVTASDDAGIALWPATLEIGRAGLGATAPEHRVNLLNRGVGALALGEPGLRGADARLRHDCPATLPAGGRCSVWVQPLTATTGSSAGGLVLPIPALGAPLLVGVSAEVRSAPLGVLSAEPAGEIDFGELVAGQVAERSIRLRNQGDAVATLGITTFTGPDRTRFELGGDCPAGLPMAPGSACTAVLRYRPAVAGRAQASLQWRSDALNPGNLLLSGTATVLATPPPAPAPAPSPAPAPAPAPAAPPTTAGGGGGCSLALRPAGSGQTVDPLLPWLTALSAWCLWRRRGRPGKAG